MQGRACNESRSQDYQGRNNMDNQKKEKIVAIIVTSLVSLAVSIIACIFGVSPDSIAVKPEMTAVSSVYQTVEI